MKEREITALEEGLGYHFRRRAVIEQAVTHSSQAREQEAQQAGESKYKVSDNEQLEFLGDAVLALVTSEELFQRFPAVSRRRTLEASGASGQRTASDPGGTATRNWATICVWDGAKKRAADGVRRRCWWTRWRRFWRRSIWMAGLEVAREFVLRNVIAPELERMERGGGTLPVTDFKSALQEAVQSLGLPQPAYVLVEEAGPEHSKTFTVEARLHMKNGKDVDFVGRAQGSTKKTAEQDAARQLLTFLASRPKPAEGKTHGTGNSHSVDK